MKAIFAEPAIEVVTFSVEDVITTSGVTPPPPGGFTMMPPCL